MITMFYDFVKNFEKIVESDVILISNSRNNLIKTVLAKLIHNLFWN